MRIVFQTTEPSYDFQCHDIGIFNKIKRSSTLQIYLITLKHILSQSWCKMDSKTNPKHSFRNNSSKLDLGRGGTPTQQKQGYCRHAGLQQIQTRPGTKSATQPPFWGKICIICCSSWRVKCEWKTAFMATKDILLGTLSKINYGAITRHVPATILASDQGHCHCNHGWHSCPTKIRKQSLGHLL